MLETGNASSYWRTTARGLLAGAAFWLILAGAIALQTQVGLTGVGLGLCGAGLTLFLWAYSAWQPGMLVRGLERLGITRRKLLLALAFGLSLLATVGARAYTLFDQRNFTLISLVWVGAIFTVILAYIPAGGPPLAGYFGQKGRRREALLLGVILTMGVALRFYALGILPRIINGDEGFLGQSALATNRPPLNNPFTVISNVGAVYLQGIAVGLRLFGISPFSLRLGPALLGSLAILATYLLGRRLFGPRVGLLGAALLAVSHAHIQFSRTVGVPYTPGTLLIPLELYLFISGLENHSRFRLALSGVALGLHFGIYLGAQIIGPLLAIYLLVALWLCRPLVQAAARQLPAFALALGVTILPQATHFWLAPAEFQARLNADGLLQTGWLSQQMTVTGQPMAAILAGRVANAFLALIQTPAHDFYGTYLPLLNPITSALFLLGLVIALWRTRDPRYLLINGYVWSITLAVGLFALPPSADSYRMVMALPGVMVVAALGLDRLSRLLTLNQPDRGRLRLGVNAAVVGAVLVLNVQAYFVDFANSCQYGDDIQTRFASYFGGYLGTLDRETEVYLLSNAIVRYGTHTSVDFLSHTLPVINHDDSASTLKARPNIAVIAIPSRADELRAWAIQFPGGKLHREFDCQNLILLAYALPNDWRPSPEN